MKSSRKACNIKEEEDDDLEDWNDLDREAWRGGCIIIIESSSDL